MADLQFPISQRDFIEYFLHNIVHGYLGMVIYAKIYELYAH